MWSRKKKRNKHKLYIYALALLLIAFTETALLDATEHIYSTHRHGCTVEIYDAYGLLDPDDYKGLKGVCYYRGLTIHDLRVLGKTDAETIIIVTHVFKHGDDAYIGVSNNISTYYPLFHPLTALYIAKGVGYDNKTYVAVKPEIIGVLTHGLYGKRVVLITCGFRGVEKLADKLLSAGAVEVVYPRYEYLDASLINEMVHDILCNNTDNPIYVSVKK